MRKDSGDITVLFVISLFSMSIRDGNTFKEEGNKVFGPNAGAGPANLG